MFCLVSGRYERGSIVITYNKAFDEWGRVFSNCGEPGTVEELLGAAIRRM